MPIVTVTLATGRPQQQLEQIAETVLAAMQSAFELPPASRNLRLLTLPPEQLYLPAGEARQRITIEIALFPGRSAEAKAALYRKITDGLVELLAIAPRQVMIQLQEIPLENWGLGGEPATVRYGNP